MATITYKCPNCGGPVSFDPKTQKYKCEYCQSLFLAEDLQMPDEASEQTEGAPREESARGSAEQKEEGGALIYTCPSCGAQIVTDESTAATFCYYCHNPVVLQGRLSGDYLPDSVVPFMIDRKKAEEDFRGYVKHKRFVPRAFFSKDQIEKLSGVYYPFWVYECTLRGGQEGNARRVRVYIQGDTVFTDTSVFRYEREGDVDVRNITVNALKNSDRRLIESVQPFRLNETKPFNMGYLQGFFAQRRDMESEEIGPSVRERARKLAEDAVRNTVTGYTTVTPEQSRFDVASEKFSYLLLPVWVLTYGAADGKKYYFAMNGQTGETHGVLPVAYARLAAFAGIMAGLACALSLAVTYFV